MWSFRLLMQCIAMRMHIWLIINSRRALEAEKKSQQIQADFIFYKSSAQRSSALECLMSPIKKERKSILGKLAAKQLFELYFLQCNNLILIANDNTSSSSILSCISYLNLFWRDKIYCKFVILISV